MRLSITLFFLTAIASAHSQTIYESPYDLTEFHFYNQLIGRNYAEKTGISEIKKYRIERSVFGGLKARNKKLEYHIRFKEDGNPTQHIEYGSPPLRWRTQLLVDLRLHKKSIDVRENYYEYDSLNRYFKTTTIDRQAYSKSWDEVVSQNEYDELGRVSVQTTETRWLYPAGFKYRGVEYPNDTSILKTYFHYDSNSTIDFIVCHRSDWDRYKRGKPVDTIYPKQPIKKVSTLNKRYYYISDAAIVIRVADSNSIRTAFRQTQFVPEPPMSPKKISRYIRQNLPENHRDYRYLEFYERGVLVYRDFGKKNTSIFYQYDWHKGEEWPTN